MENCKPTWHDIGVSLYICTDGLWETPPYVTLRSLMSSATPFRFSNGSELLMRLGNNPHFPYTVQVGWPSENPGEGTSITAGESTVTSIKAENWANSSVKCRNFENETFQQSQQEALHSNIDRLELLASVASESSFGSGSPSLQYTPNMSAYISGSSAQSESLQTLHLMNSNFTGYRDSSDTSNVVLVNAMGDGQGSPLGSAKQQQQQFTRFALPSTLNQMSYSQPSRIAAAANAELGNHNSYANFYSRRPCNQGYSWGSGNEFLCLPSGHVSESNQEIHINSMKPEQLCTHDVSHFGMGSMTTSLYHDQAPLFANSIAVAQSVNMDNLQQTHSNGGNILSHSLSPKQPAMMQLLHSFPIEQNDSTANFLHGLANTGSDILSKEIMPLSSKCAGNTVGCSFNIPSSENLLGWGYHPQVNSAENRHGELFSGHLTIGRHGCRYLKPAQELLNEVVSVGPGLGGNSSKSLKLQSWMVSLPSSGNDDSLMKNMNAVESPSKAVISWSRSKEAECVGNAAASISILGNPENARGPAVGLSSADRQELQEKRAKLVGMRDELDRRYKQYYHHMQVVATSFETAAGLGAAASYTALALQISKHFRCLRDAITAQIQATIKTLGEEEFSCITRGETSKLRQINQQLRQQRTLRQLGMVQQQAWRPQRGLPEQSVSILRAWLFEHFLHPYPKDSDKTMLAKQTGLNRNQVSNWFINARVRLWKPMVEEMYLEEIKEADAERVPELEGSNKDPGTEGDRAGMDGSSTTSELGKPSKQARSSGENSQGFDEKKVTSIYPSDELQSRVLSGQSNGTTDHALHQEEGIMQQGVTDLRPVTKDISFFSGVDYRTIKANVDYTTEDGNEGSQPGDSYKKPYGVSTYTGFVRADQMDLTGNESYQMHGVSRYCQENFGGGTGHTANGDVSLTLGLQHREGISCSGGKQQYAAQGVASHLLTSRQQDDVSSANYYNVSENSGYGVLGLQSRKPFSVHMLCQDFVV